MRQDNDCLARNRVNFYSMSVGQLWTTALRVIGIPAVRISVVPQPVSTALGGCASGRWVDHVRLSAPR
jgi:hypothetical protein